MPARELPRGTVTFLFTDIEGSTRLLQELGDGYPEALGEHRRLLREAFARHGGVEVDTQGDAFFVAFERASEALAAAAEAQRALEPGPIRVRIGIHSGEPTLSGEGYVGLDVHRAARIAAAGHGGQVLVSQSARELADRDLRDLGEHRLKDLSAPERIYQVGDEDFPPLKSLNQTNLPIQPTPLVGRERELAEVSDLLRSARLVTITGAGGSGKTRLALQAAAELTDEFADGVWFVSLAPLREPGLIESTVAQTLGVTDPRPLVDQLAGKQILLLLDNFEQLLEAGETLATLLERTPSLKLLVTSRACLRLAAESEYPLAPLVEESAVELFVARARSAKPTFEPDEHVPQICRRLDNLPLALELGAARIRLLTPEAMLARLERRLPLLTGGARDAPERQRTLRATIDWSYDLLDSVEQELFPRLAVFAGSFELEAAERVSGAEMDSLQALVEKSLLRQTQEGRFFMLETVGEYAGEVLAAGEEERDVRRRHAAYYLRLAKEMDRPIRDGPDLDALARMRLEQDNCRAALEFLLQAEDAAGALRLATALGYFWYLTGQLREGRAWFERTLGLADPGPQVARAHALNTVAGIVMHSGDAAAARMYTEQALTVWRELGETEAVVRSLNELANAAVLEDRLAEASEYTDEALELARTLDDPLWVALLRSNMGEIKLFDGRVAEARALFQEAHAAAREHHFSVGIGWSLLGLANVELAEHSPAEARERLFEALSVANEFGYMDLMGGCLDVAAGLAGCGGNDEGAAWFLGAADAVDATAGSAWRRAPVVEQLVGAAREHLGEPAFERARKSGGSSTADAAVAAVRDYLD